MTMTLLVIIVFVRIRVSLTLWHYGPENSCGGAALCDAGCLRASLASMSSTCTTVTTPNASTYRQMSPGEQNYPRREALIWISSFQSDLFRTHVGRYENASICILEYLLVHFSEHICKNESAARGRRLC